MSSGWRSWKKISVLASAVLLIVGGLPLWLALQRPLVNVPAYIARQVSFRPHLPHKLPGNYRPLEDSFSVDQNAMIYQIGDDTGHSITFSEQSKPKDPNFFVTFQQAQLKDAKIIDGAPYPSTAGKTQDGSTTLLSIVAPHTWLLISAHFSIDEDALALIARNIQNGY